MTLLTSVSLSFVIRLLFLLLLTVRFRIGIISTGNIFYIRRNVKELVSSRDLEVVRQGTGGGERLLRDQLRMSGNDLQKNLSGRRSDDLRQNHSNSKHELPRTVSRPFFLFVFFFLLIFISSK